MKPATISKKLRSSQGCGEKMYWKSSPWCTYMTGSWAAACILLTVQSNDTFLLVMWLREEHMKPTLCFPFTETQKKCNLRRKQTHIQNVLAYLTIVFVTGNFVAKQHGCKVWNHVTVLTYDSNCKSPRCISR